MSKLQPLPPNLPSTAERGTDDFIIYHTDDGKAQIALYADVGDVWLSQQGLAELFDTSVPNINTHIKNIFDDKELEANSVIKDYLITAADGKSYHTHHYALAMILAIGFRVRSARGVQFRQWANTHLQTYLTKGFVVDSDRLKNPNGRPDYFDELLEKIRDIRASELRFYQKVRDLFKLCTDYDPSDKATQMFFAQTQNKLLYAVTQRTAAELVTQRANANAPDMGLTNYKGSQVRKQDIYTAKNYLNADELDTLNRLVSVFLETAELRAKNRNRPTMQYWRENVDKLLVFNDYPVLDHKGKISKAQMETRVKTIYADYDAQRKVAQAERADAEDRAEAQALDELEAVEKRITGGKT